MTDRVTHRGRTFPAPTRGWQIPLLFPSLAEEFRAELRQKQRERWLLEEDEDARLARVITGGDDDADEND